MARKTPLAVLLVVSSPIQQAWTCWLLVVCWHSTSESQTFFQQYACNNGHHPALVLVPRKICISCFTLVAPHCVASQCLLAGSCCASEGTIQASSLKRSASCAFLAAPAQTLVASVAPAQDKRVVHELSIIEQAWNVTAKPGTNAMKGTLPLRLCEPQSGSMAQVEQPCSELRLAVGVGLT